DQGAEPLAEASVRLPARARLPRAPVRGGALVSRSSPLRIDITVEDLHRLRERIYAQALEGEDWVVVGALVSKFIARTEAQQARLKAKAAQQEQAAALPVNDVGHGLSVEDAESNESAEPEAGTGH